jgi:DNA polymerase-1
VSANLFASADFDGLELRTMAESCIQLVGFSKMAEALNSGQDVHLALAATILGISYAEAELRKEAGDKQIDDARQAAKVANFGFAGGLGAEKFVLFARKAYKVKLTVAQAKQLKRDWLATWPEFVEYFKIHSALSEAAGAQGITLKHFFSNRLRGGATYSAACNSRFQGLGADATGNAAFLISEACYVVPESALFGARMVNYVHDEFILECLRERGHDAAQELVRLMVQGAAPYLPHVPATAKPLLSAYWSKEAFPLFDAAKRLFPWDAELGAIVLALPKSKEQKPAASELGVVLGSDSYDRAVGKRILEIKKARPKAKFKIEGRTIEVLEKDKPLERIAA